MAVPGGEDRAGALEKTQEGEGMLRERETEERAPCPLGQGWSDEEGSPLEPGAER